MKGDEISVEKKKEETAGKVDESIRVLNTETKFIFSFLKALI